MSILGTVNAVGLALRGAEGLVREIRRPKISDETFAQILQKQLASSDGASGESIEEITALSEKYVATRDYNGDGVLSKDESGLSSQIFQKLDTNGDGKLTAEELRAPSVNALKQAGSEK